MSHDHPDPDRLTFGCPACVDRVAADQEVAEMSDLDLLRACETGSDGAEEEMARRYGTWPNWPVLGDFL